MRGRRHNRACPRGATRDREGRLREQSHRRRRPRPLFRLCPICPRRIAFFSLFFSFGARPSTCAAFMSTVPADPFAALTDVVEVSLPAIFSDAAQPRALVGARGAPDVPYVDTEWPRDEARLLPRYQFLVSLADAIHPSATINASSVSSAIGLVDPVTRAPVIGRAAADAARSAVDRFDMRGARAALTEGVLEYARGVEADARAALARLNQRFNEADPARRASPAPPRAMPASAVAAPQQPSRLSTQQPAAPRRLPVGIRRAVASFLGRRPPAERPATAPVGPSMRPAWSAPSSRLPLGPSAVQAPLFPPFVRPVAQQQQQQKMPFKLQTEEEQEDEEEEEQEPLIKRRRRAPLSGPGLARPPSAAEDDLLLAALLDEEPPAPLARSPSSGARGWNLAAALATAAQQQQQPPMSPQTVEYLQTASPRASANRDAGPSGPVSPATPHAPPQGGERQQYESEPWTVDTYIQVVAPTVLARAVDLQTVRREARRARALADSIRDGTAARIGAGDAEAAANRALHLEDLAAYLQEPTGSARRRIEPFDAAYWYRVVAAGESAPLGPPDLLAEARGVVGPYATPEDADADASLVGFDADEAVMDAVLAWALAKDVSALDRPETAVFQVQRPRDERDPTLPPQLAARMDPGVERWVTAVVAPRAPGALDQAGALAVLAWDRATTGHGARRVGVRDVFCLGDDRLCGVVAAYESAAPDKAIALGDALVTRTAPPNVPAAIDEIANAARAIYPGAAASVGPNRDGSAVVVTVRLPVPLADADSGRVLDLVRAAYGVVAATGAPIDTEASRIVGIDAGEAPIPPPAIIVAAPMS
ncbi:hypothetical protein psal_cds_424 [Pandoravirus salinus]|uniref:Uncharacterized protein n=1 Tax=Pandoravirus salinus TaxID=1349410 RepID=S4W160_9VIRU|nr:Atrophin-1 superfamily incomplete domain [Pandoravirus salinus]AGO84152.1 hypothetical protein psal_cds_424 [Pandoravirus salinus]